MSSKSAARRATRRAEVFAAFDGKCAYCMTAPADHLDHVIPRAAGGKESRFNLVPACKPCGLSKGRRPIAEWVRILAQATTDDTD
ncbi:HNH endonuclease [Candidatus Frankia nodulisporulans]|uniref:HNH endonuclease n=1 Tax=Candidatus Frankia nodulisporulans TaxID=2060052 RepID=UPI001CDC9DB0|nr:HNH endonuclease [Candidatus Frankia nodulisporulans]